MKVGFEIQTKPETNQIGLKGNCAEDIYNLEEVQAIKNAIQEHLLFIGMDSCNNIRNVRILAIGTSKKIDVDSKEIIRTALLTASEKVILVHNHPSDSLKPSKEDLYITNFTSKVLKCFNIEMTDHLIVTDKEYYSMKRSDEINLDIKDDRTDLIENVFLKEENIKLKQKLNNNKATNKDKNVR